MVLKACREIGRKLKTRVSLLLFICLAMPAVSLDNDLDPTSESTDSLIIRYCGRVLPATNVTYNETHNIPSKFANTAKDSVIIILERVLMQLNVARNHFRNNKEIIARLYADVKKMMQTNYHYEWLPSQPFIWYNTHVRELDKDTKVFVLLPVLRDSLYNFSITLEQMRNFSETQLYMSNYITRKIILDDLSKNLIAVLCEVETALVSLNTWRNKPIPDVTGTVIVGVSGWDPNPDYTSMQIQDWGVLTTYYRFLKEWFHIIQTVVNDLNVSGYETTSAVTQNKLPAVTASTTTRIITTLRLPNLFRHKYGSYKHKRRKFPVM